MLTVDEALAAVLSQMRPLPASEVGLDAALGRVLAEDVASDVDSPPHDKSMVDGYAIRSADFQAGTTDWTVVEEILAGRVPRESIQPGTTARIMTGAPIPDGADAVVMLEQSELISGARPPRVALRCASVAAGQHIMRRGQSLRCGTVVMPRGSAVRAAEIGLLAEVGRTRLLAIARPRVAIVSTGDELVPPHERPGPGQIRNSNGPMLAALARQAGGEPLDGGIVRDDPAALAHAIERGLESDVLVLSGGVSAGVADLVPQLLADAGVRQVFHKVQLRPGKPLWFGVAPRGAATGLDRLVFGLPGNPVSSLVCFELFVRPALAGLAGLPPVGLRADRAAIGAPYQHRGDRPTYHPARVEATVPTAEEAAHSSAAIRLLDWQGSADLATLARANALACFPPGTRHYVAGQIVDFLWLAGG